MLRSLLLPQGTQLFYIITLFITQKKKLRIQRLRMKLEVRVELGQLMKMMVKDTGSLEMI